MNDINLHTTGPDTPTPPAEVYDDSVALPDEPEVTDYFKTFRSIKAGEKLQLLSRLGVDEPTLGSIGTAQLLAVAWKHRKSTTGNGKVVDLLDMTEEELFGVAGLTPDAFAEQVDRVVAEQESKSN